MPENSYLVAFAADSDPQFAARGRGPKPRPATCSTPADALGLTAHFGTAMRLYIASPAGDVLSTFDISRHDLTRYQTWGDLLEAIRASRRGPKAQARIDAQAARS
jgi:hypothetical protein